MWVESPLPQDRQEKVEVAVGQEEEREEREMVQSVGTDPAETLARIALPSGM